LNEKIRVLIVDDEIRFVENISKLLRHRGFEVSEAFDGYQAIETIRADDRFDVVILDIKMPGLDGIATLKELKKLNPEIEVIMLTGHASLDSGIQAIRCGAFDYLMKPCDIENLVEKINEAHELEQIKRHPVLWPRNTVGDITLSSFIKLETEDPLPKALDVFNRETWKMVVEEVFIQDQRGHFKGVITKRDLIDEAEKAHPHQSFTWTDLINNPKLLPAKPLKGVMRAVHPLTTFPEESLTDAAHRMVTENVRCMPVVDNGKVLGIVRLRDILQHIDHETE